MSFQDVGRPGSRPPQRKQTQTSPTSGGSFSSGTGGGIGGGTDGNTSGGFEQLSDGIVQYQRNVALLEKISRSVGTKNDTSVLKTQYNLQLDVIRQLGERIEKQLRHNESRLSTLPRAEAAQSRTTHVKLTRDYRLVEQQFRNIQLDMRRKRGLAEAKMREIEEEERKRKEMGEEELKEEEARRQMLIEEDRINEEIMREREEEIRKIHKGMHQVNEIYKDLAHLVDSQQEAIDKVETQMENTNQNAQAGLKHIEKANESSQSQCVVS